MASSATSTVPSVQPLARQTISEPSPRAASCAKTDCLKSEASIGPMDLSSFQVMIPIESAISKSFLRMVMRLGRLDEHSDLWALPAASGSAPPLWAVSTPFPPRGAMG